MKLFNISNIVILLILIFLNPYMCFAEENSDTNNSLKLLFGSTDNGIFKGNLNGSLKYKKNADFLNFIDFSALHAELKPDLVIPQKYHKTAKGNFSFNIGIEGTLITELSVNLFEFSLESTPIKNSKDYWKSWQSKAQYYGAGVEWDIPQSLEFLEKYLFTKVRNPIKLEIKGEIKKEINNSISNEEERILVRIVPDQIAYHITKLHIAFFIYPEYVRIWSKDTVPLHYLNLETGLYAPPLNKLFTWTGINPGASLPYFYVKYEDGHLPTNYESISDWSFGIGNIWEF